MFEDLIVANLKEAQTLLQTLLSDKQFITTVNKASELLGKAVVNGRKILSCGNGGSMCDAMHFAEELTGRFRDDRKPIAAIAISDASHISCVSNDYGYDYIFSRYIEAWGSKGDVLLAISTSGNSKNILYAAQVAKEIGMTVIALTGKNGGQLAELCDIEMRVPHFAYADRIQEVHIKLIHIMIECIEIYLKKNI